MRSEGYCILWRSSLRASPLLLSDCDRMCGLQIELRGKERRLSILGVYMPGGEQPQDCYDTYFDSVEHCVSQLSNGGPLLVLGDLNAHLGCRDTSVTNSRGNKWIKMMDEHSLINVSLCSIASGPTYTYTSGNNTTTIDYIISNSDAFRGIASCSILEEHPLNTSDHLPITCSLNLSHIRTPSAPISSSSNLDWSTAVKECIVPLYSKASDDAVGSRYTLNCTELTILCHYAHTC